MKGLSNSGVLLLVLVISLAIPSALVAQETDGEESATWEDQLPDVSALFETHRDKVLSVQTELAPLFGAFGPMFGAPNGEPPRGQGTGFIVDADGLAITNWHVVADAHSIQVTTAEGASYSARLVGADPSTDIALLEIDAPTPMEAARLGSAQDISPGEWVFAVGSPFGLEHSVTVGVLSAKGRQIGLGPYDDFLQTDASINPGNSGGPLFNLQGEVIGVNTAIIRNGRGIGFAVPIDTVTAILPELRDRGYVVRGFLGAGVQEMSRDLAETFELEPRDGVLIRSIEPGGPADRANIEPGDVVTHIGDERTREPSELLATVATVSPGDAVTVRFIRDGQSQEVDVTVAERPDPQRQRVERTRDADHDVDPTRLGVSFRSVSPDMRRRHNLPGDVGVYVDRVETGSPASGVLHRGDIILRIGDTEVSRPEDLPSALRAQPRDRPIRMLIQRRGEPRFVAVRLAAD